jgi:glycerol-3-phosphate O-acyltransferase/dihydroxyacetone phosphate acyltransferase
MMSFTKELKSYTTSLAALGLKDHQLLMTESKHNHFPMFFLLTKLLYRLIKFSILAFLTLPGLVLFAPVFILTRRMSHKKTAEALAASSVKIKAHDVMATWKILIAVALAPCFYLFYSVLLVFLSSRNLTLGLIPQSTSTLTIVLLSWLILPAISYASLLFGEQGMDLLKSLYPLLLSLNPRSSRVIERLREQRKR